MAKAPNRSRAGRARPTAEEPEDDGQLENLGDDDKNESSDEEGDEGEEGKGDEEGEGEGDEEGEDPPYVSLLRDPSIWIVYVDIYAAQLTLVLSSGALFRMDVLGNIELCDAGRDGEVQWIVDAPGFVGTIERHRDESAQMAENRALLELADRIKDCWQRTQEARDQLRSEDSAND